MSDSPFDPACEEYAALRATIRERGSLRVTLLVATMGIWGALVVATSAALSLPVGAVIPLLVLAAGFEAIASLHVGVERIGRYVQVRFEGDLPPATAGLRTWERTSMAWGRQFPGTGTDPLFVGVFYLATAVNFVPVALVGMAPELAVLGLVHLAFAWRVWSIRAWTGRQRAEDLARYQQLLGEPPAQPR